MMKGRQSMSQQIGFAFFFFFETSCWLMLPLHCCGSLMTYGLLAQPFLPPVHQPHRPTLSPGSSMVVSVETLAAGVSGISLEVFTKINAGDKLGISHVFVPAGDFAGNSQKNHWQKHLNSCGLVDTLMMGKQDRLDWLLGEFRESCDPVVAKFITWWNSLAPSCCRPDISPRPTIMMDNDR